MEDATKKLTDELRSLLDEATILSIISDYDLTNSEEYTAARDVLLAISKDVEAEEATGFNPSGLGADVIVDINPPEQDHTAAVGPVNESDLKSNDGLTATTENSQHQSSHSAASSKTSTHDSAEPLHIDIFDGLSVEEKESQLAAMFTSLKPIDVKLALQKSKGDASLAIDELLNLEWLEETGQRLKGVDAFYVSDDEAKIRKKKGRKKRKGPRPATSRASSSLDVSGEAVDGVKANNEHVQFLSSCFNLSEDEAARIYHRHDGSLGAALSEILDNYIAVGLPQMDHEIATAVQKQANKFSWVPRKYISPVSEVCSTEQGALDVIEALANFYEKPSHLKVDVPYKLATSNLELLSIDTSVPKHTSRGATPRTPSVASPSQPWTSPTTLRTAADHASVLAESRNHSFSSAAAAFRKGKSDPLFRQAAAVYAERGREQAMNHRQANSIQANYMVDQQSTQDTVDLHGVTVADGVEIAIDRVWRWWDNLGEDRTRKAREGYTVVTGYGRHSTDGKSRLRSNVFKALVADGWKVEVMTGSYLVTGRRR
ncbi:hypothetical protein F4778DRAFT_721897 [Xylariomycetidae sp. FL2044]|nr:hypothetical protein F4778DRAFT_721897 [Xylariomycetidae sp. FL2044]